MGKGNLVGATDSIAGDVRDTPVSPKDVLATAFYLLGIDPDTVVNTLNNRPVKLVAEDAPIIKEAIV